MYLHNEEAPTPQLRWNDGKLEQLWRCRTGHAIVEEWRLVPTVIEGLAMTESALPELPEPRPLMLGMDVVRLHWRFEGEPRQYGASDMTAYGRQCYEAGVAAERERAAKIATSHAMCGCNGEHGRCNVDDAPLSIAAAIRKGAPG